MFQKKTNREYKLNQEFPTHTCIETEKGLFYLNVDFKRYRITSNEIFKSWNFPYVIKSFEEEVKHYPIAVTKLSFRNGTLVYNIKDAKIYVVSGNRLRHVSSPSVLERLGLGINDAMVVSDSDINSIKRGEDIT